MQLKTTLIQDNNAWPVENLIIRLKTVITKPNLSLITAKGIVKLIVLCFKKKKDQTSTNTTVSQSAPEGYSSSFSFVVNSYKPYASTKEKLMVDCGATR
jgi:hypothetical protein